MLTNRIDGNLLKKVMVHAAAILRQNINIVDSLNVFPVPDGDTGTNMSLTMDKAIKELEKVPSDSLKKVADTAAWGSLMGARGNSGVILSQLFRGFAQGIPAHKDSIGPLELAMAYKKGVDAAYRAVMRPVEGTILTVARETADKMIFEAKRTTNLEKIFENTLIYGKKVLEKTPEMLKVLKDAGVVDAGGKGLLYLLMGCEEVIKNPHLEIKGLEEGKTSPVQKKSYDETGQKLEYMYCTELFITGDKIKEDIIKKELSGFGDSIIVIGTGNLVKIHIHTNNPDLVLGSSLKWGELSNIKIDNMKIQHREMINHSIKIQKGDNKHQQKVEDKDKINIGVIAVSQGEGLNEIFESLGADIIDGGQSMNPSTEDIFALVEEKTYEHTIILPNNKNIILTAEQVKGLSKNNVYVLPTKSIPQGISALLAFNPDFTINDNISNMSQNMKNVISGEVTYAVRDTKWNNTKINKGDVIGIKEGKLQIIGNDLEETAVDLIDLMTKDKREGIITIYYGLTVKESTIKKTMEALAQKHEDYDIEYYFGGQDLYQFIISVE